MKITFKFQILNSAFCNHSNIQSTINQIFNQQSINQILSNQLITQSINVRKFKQNKTIDAWIAWNAWKISENRKYKYRKYRHYRAWILTPKSITVKCQFNNLANYEKKIIRNACQKIHERSERTEDLVQVYKVSRLYNILRSRPESPSHNPPRTSPSHNLPRPRPRPGKSVSRPRPASSPPTLACTNKVMNTYISTHLK